MRFKATILTNLSGDLSLLEYFFSVDSSANCYKDATLEALSQFPHALSVTVEAMS